MFFLFLSFACYSLNFDQAFVAAKENNIDYQQVKINQMKAAAFETQAKSSVYPSLSLISSTEWFDTSRQASSLFDRDGKSHTARANLRQTLFNGGENYQSYQYAKLLPLAAKLETKVKEQNLYVELADLFYSTYYLKEQIKIKTEEIQLLKQRLNTLNKRYKIGQSRSTEVLSAKSQLAIANSEKAALDVVYYESMSDLKAVLGTNKDLLLENNKKVLELSLQKIRRKNLEDLARQKIQNQKVEIARRQYQAAKGAFWPSLEVAGNYYLDRPSASRGIDWDISLVASWELFSGSQDLSNLRLRSYDLKFQEALKDHENLKLKLDYDRYFQVFDLRQKELKSLSKSIQLSQKVYLQTTKDYKKGLVTNLDVLDSLNRYLSNKLQAKKVEQNLLRVYHRVKAINEDLP